MSSPAAFFIASLLASHAFAQTTDAPLRFEVASVKPAPPMDPRDFSWHSGPSTNRYLATNATLRAMLLYAYDLKDYQLQGPPWMETERYQVNAKAPEGTSPKQIREMLQTLLLERFRMTVHREQRDATVYSLTVKNGHKMRESAPDPNPLPPADLAGAPPTIPPRPTGPPETDKDGYPVLTRSGLISMSSPDGLMKISASRQTMSDLIRLLTFQLGRDIIDQTGLTARYDFRLAYGGSGRVFGGMRPMPSPAQPGEASDPSGSSGPTIFGALQDQLGLKLEAGKAPRETVVVDKAEKMPIEN